MRASEVMLDDVTALGAWLGALSAEVAVGAEVLVRDVWRSVLRRLSLASLDEVAELRRRLDEVNDLRSRLDALEALVRQGGGQVTAQVTGHAGDEAGPPREPRLSLRVRESLGRARAALDGLGVPEAESRSESTASRRKGVPRS